MGNGPGRPKPTGSVRLMVGKKAGWTAHRDNLNGLRGKGGVRGKINGEQSSKSRKRFMLEVVNWEKEPNLFYTRTFTDEDMMIRNPQERVKYRNDSLKRFKEFLEYHYPETEGYWKGEWQDRKKKESPLHGHLVPHFHDLLHIPGLTEENADEIGRRLGVLWMKALQTTVPEKALRVATNKESWQYLDGTHTRLKQYLGKYCNKLSKNPPDIESTGRHWGKIGKPSQAEKISVELQPREEIWLARLLWRKWQRNLKKRSGPYYRMFKENVSRLQVYGMESHETMMNMIQAAKVMAGSDQAPIPPMCPF